MTESAQDYFAMTDSEEIIPLGVCKNISEAFDREPPNTHWVFSREGLTALYEKIGKLLASRDSQSKGLPQRETVEAAGNPDSEHLDWLEAHPEFLLRMHKGRWFCAPFTNYPYNSYSTLREALRAAVEGTWNK